MYSTGVSFRLIWSEIGSRFNHLGLKSGKVFVPSLELGSQIGYVFWADTFFDVIQVWNRVGKITYFGLKKGKGLKKHAAQLTHLNFPRGTPSPRRQIIWATVIQASLDDPFQAQVHKLGKSQRHFNHLSI